MTSKNNWDDVFFKSFDGKFWFCIKKVGVVVDSRDLFASWPSIFKDLDKKIADEWRSVEVWMKQKVKLLNQSFSSSNLFYRDVMFFMQTCTRNIG